jgi:hypothetical protein
LKSLSAHDAFQLSYVLAVYFRNESHSKASKRRSAGNGLRQFAEDVLRKVERKGVTTYNEVADELVADMYRTSTSKFLVSEIIEMSDMCIQVPGIFFI